MVGLVIVVSGIVTIACLLIVLSLLFSFFEEIIETYNNFWENIAEKIKYIGFSLLCIAFILFIINVFILIIK